MRIFDLWSKSELNLLAKPYNMCMQRIRLTDIFYKRCGYRYDNRKNIHGHQSLRATATAAECRSDSDASSRLPGTETSKRA